MRLEEFLTTFNSATEFIEACIQRALEDKEFIDSLPEELQELADDWESLS